LPEVGRKRQAGQGGGVIFGNLVKFVRTEYTGIPKINVAYRIAAEFLPA
jgi:hypothetical protein